jgi:hypothetical protein
MNIELTTRTLKTVAQWVRMIQECPYCAECRREVADLTATIPPVMVKKHTDAEWDHVTSRAIAAFLDVLREAGVNHKCEAKETNG